MTKSWQEGDVNSNGVSIHYYRTGGDKPKLVLLHGITDNGLCWSRLAGALEPYYDIIMIDARGHGLSDRASCYLPQEHIADIKAVIDALGIAKAAVLGHSMGAVNASYFAVAHSEKVTCLLLEDPPWHLEPGTIIRDHEQWRKDIALKRTRTLEDLMAAGKLENPLWDDSVFPSWAEAKRQADPDVIDWADQGRTLANWRELATNLSCPSLLITGGPAAIVTPETAELARTLNAQIQVVTMPEAGHSIRRDAFKDYLAAVRTFLSQAVSG